MNLEDREDEDRQNPCTQLPLEWRALLLFDVCLVDEVWEVRLVSSSSSSSFIINILFITLTCKP